MGMVLGSLEALGTLFKGKLQLLLRNFSEQADYLIPLFVTLVPKIPCANF